MFRNFFPPWTVIWPRHAQDMLFSLLPLLVQGDGGISPSPSQIGYIIGGLLSEIHRSRTYGSTHAPANSEKVSRRTTHPGSFEPLVPNLRLVVGPIWPPLACRRPACSCGKRSGSARKPSSGRLDGRIVGRWTGSGALRFKYAQALFFTELERRRPI